MTKLHDAICKLTHDINKFYGVHADGRPVAEIKLDKDAFNHFVWDLESSSYFQVKDEYLEGKLTYMGIRITRDE